MTNRKLHNSYGDLRAQLDETLAKLQSPDCDVDEAVALYEQALGYVKQLEQYLQTAESKVKKVQADFSQPEVET
jgi:exodeoxyribonuclease VII small subunit